VTGDLLAAAWTAADPLGGSLRERIQGCQLCCLGLEACFGLSLLGADTGQIGLQLPEGGRHMGQDVGEREYRPGLWMICRMAKAPVSGGGDEASLRLGDPAGGQPAVPGGRSCLAAARVAQQPSNISEMLNQGTPGPRR
jgi:hypothetical protein